MNVGSPLPRIIINGSHNLHVDVLTSDNFFDQRTSRGSRTNDKHTLALRAVNHNSPPHNPKKPIEVSSE